MTDTLRLSPTAVAMLPDAVREEYEEVQRLQGELHELAQAMQEGRRELAAAEAADREALAEAAAKGAAKLPAAKAPKLAATLEEQGRRLEGLREAVKRARRRYVEAVEEAMADNSLSARGESAVDAALEALASNLGAVREAVEQALELLAAGVWAARAHRPEELLRPPTSGDYGEIRQAFVALERAVEQTEERDRAARDRWGLVDGMTEEEAEELAAARQRAAALERASWEGYVQVWSPHGMASTSRGGDL